MPTSTTQLRGRQGFASIDLKRLREICSMGGKAAHKCGKAHKWTPEDAAAAGRKGGVASQKKLRAKLSVA